jgi:hypothetical protein
VTSVLAVTAVTRPWFFSRFPEPLAEGIDALAPPDWGCSRCQHCGALHRECVFAFQPRALLPAFVVKARADGLRGIVIVPFTPSDPAWPALTSVSLKVEGPLPDPSELGSVRLRGGGPGRRAALGHPGGRLQSLVLSVVGRRRLALCCSRGAPAAAFASELARRGGSSAHCTGAPAAGWRFRRPKTAARPETAARRTLERLCRRIRRKIVSRAYPRLALSLARAPCRPGSHWLFCNL